MKKKVLLVMGLSLLLLAGGCGKAGAAGDLKNNSSTDKSSTKVLPEKKDYVASKYVKLGKYKDVEVTITKQTVTDKQVEDTMKQQLANIPAYEEVKGKTVVAKGDTVNIDYVGLKDGKAFQGGTDKGAHLTIGSGQFIEGFESGLIGHKVGEKVTLNITFPKNYSSTELAGQAVVFNVTINKIEKQITPSLSDDFIKNNTEYKSVADFKEAIRKQLEADNDNAKQSEMETNLINKIVADSKFSSIPKDLQQYYKDYLNYQAEQSAKQYGMDLKSYISQMGMDTKAFDKYVDDYSATQAKQEIALKAIAETENMKVSDQEVKDKVAELMKSYGKKEKEIYEMMSKKEIKNSLLLQKAYGFIMDSCELKTVSPTPAPTATPKAK